MNANQQSVMTKTQRREQRLQALFDSCEQQMLQQLIGPFGLTPAMFEDKTGGNVTTVHNFKQGITATADDQSKFEQLQDKKDSNFDRKNYDYDKELPKKRKELFKKDGDIESAYTGKKLTKDGQTHLDHVVAAKTIEMDDSANLFMTAEQRVAMANQDANLVACESSINQSMQDKDKREWANQPRKKDNGKTNAESFDIDQQKFDNTVKAAERAVKSDILMAQIKKQGAELAVSGVKEAGRNALRQALGVLRYEFVNGAFIEIKQLITTPDDGSLVERMIDALKRVAQRVMSKWRDARDALVSGGLQGFISNLLTFIINSVVTTSAKVVTIIREGMKGLWQAIKLLLNPPKDMPLSEVCRQVTKILAGVVTLGLGMMFEESIKAFISSVVILAPLADLLAPVISGILTGVATALIIYSIDRCFDWWSETGTELLQGQQAHLEQMHHSIHHMANWIELQFACSTSYRAISDGYLAITADLDDALATSQQIVDMNSAATARRAVTINELSSAVTQYKENQQTINAFFDTLSQDNNHGR